MARRSRGNGVLTALLCIFLIVSCIFNGVLGYFVIMNTNSIRKENQELKERLNDLEARLTETEEMQTASTEEEEIPEAAAASSSEYLPEELPSDSDQSGRVPMSELNPGDILDSSLYAGYEGEYFTSCEIQVGDEIYNRINGKSYRENEYISLSELRYLKMLHYNYNGEIQVGEMIVNVGIADTILMIFRELYDQHYQIYSMYLIDNFWPEDPYVENPGNRADDNSCVANNTSCFCYRPLTGGGNLSQHALGRAVDVNPVENPYVTVNEGSGERYVYDPASSYYMYESDRDQHPEHCIHKDDVCYTAFMGHGCTNWGGFWYPVIDYQHFEWIW